MSSLGEHYQAIVIGSRGAIGGAFVRGLQLDPRCTKVIGVSRSSVPGLDLQDEFSIAQCAQLLKAHAPYALIVDATGALAMAGKGPEKRLGDLNADQLLQAFSINAVGPALVLKHFVDLMPVGTPAIYAKLSARVGSISDNRKGGWYGYRASKAALNMILQSAALECTRLRPQLVLAALQPGTVRSDLSAPFVAAQDAMDPDAAVAGLLTTLNGLSPQRGAQFVDYRGQLIAW